jgi:hypothetical protein
MRLKEHLLLLHTGETASGVSLFIPQNILTIGKARLCNGKGVPCPANAFFVSRNEVLPASNAILLSANVIFGLKNAKSYPWKMNYSPWNRIYDLWYAVCNPWKTIFKSWKMNYEPWYAICDPREMISESWKMNYEPWYTVCNLWETIYDSRYMIYNPWYALCGLWEMIFESWKMIFMTVEMMFEFAVAIPVRKNMREEYGAAKL